MSKKREMATVTMKKKLRQRAELDYSRSFSNFELS